MNSYLHFSDFIRLFCNGVVMVEDANATHQLVEGGGGGVRGKGGTRGRREGGGGTRGKGGMRGKERDEWGWGD